MLNLLRFRAVADYSAHPHSRSGQTKFVVRTPINATWTTPIPICSGGEVIFYGAGGPFLIGPANERWDAAMLVRQNSLAAFLAFIQAIQPVFQASDTASPRWKIHACCRLLRPSHEQIYEKVDNTMTSRPIPQSARTWA